MAYIDKIYVESHKEFFLFYDWCIKFQDLCKCETQLNILDYFYFTPDDVREGYYNGGLPISNFSETINKWLYLHCPIEFVRNRLLEQYGRTFENIKEKNIKLYIDRG